MIKRVWFLSFKTWDKCVVLLLKPENLKLVIFFVLKNTEHTTQCSISIEISFSDSNVVWMRAIIIIFEWKRLLFRIQSEIMDVLLISSWTQINSLSSEDWQLVIIQIMCFNDTSISDCRCQCTKKIHIEFNVNWTIYLPFGIPHGPFVLELSKKSKSYFRAGGYVNATWACINGKQLKIMTFNANTKHFRSFIFRILIVFNIRFIRVKLQYFP